MDLEQRRLKLHEFLCELIGTRNCYYSPPSSIEMIYPCVVYDLANPNLKRADNIAYLIFLKWTITVIDEDPDSKIASRFFMIPKCTLSSKFESDDLNHFVFSLYF